MAADFSLLQTPNFAQAALGGLQAGAALGKQRQLDQAMAGIDLSKPETLMPILRADPATGAALISASSKLADAAREASSRDALSNYLTALQPGQEPHSGAVQAIMPGAPAIGASGVPGAPANGDTPATAATPAQAPSNDPNAIVVNAPRPAAIPDLAAARAALIKSDPENFLKIQDSLATMGKNQRAALDDATSAFGNVIEAGKDSNGNWLPPAQLKGIVQANRDMLIQHGMPASQIDSFDGSAASAQTVENQVLGIKGILEQHDKDRTFAETVRQHGVENAQGQQRIGIEAQNAGTAAAHLGIDRAHLSLDQQKEAREAGAGAGGAPIVQQRILSNGVHAYRNPATGKWYDNAAFK